MSPEELSDAYWTHSRLTTAPDGSFTPSDETEWAHEMAEAVITGQSWTDWDAKGSGQPERAPPAIDPVDFLVLLAEGATDGIDDPLGSLGADLVWTYLFQSPDVAKVEDAARRSDRFREALCSTWYDNLIPPEDVIRLRKLGALGKPRWSQNGG